VRGQVRRPARRYRRVPQHRRRIPGGLGVVSQHRRVGASMLLQGGEHTGVQVPLPARRDPGLNCHPGQLMPEPEAGSLSNHNSRHQAIIGDAPRVGQDRRQQPAAHPRPDHRGGLHRAASRRGRAGEPRANHIPHGRGHRRPPGRQDLGHKERVAAGDPVQLSGVHVALPSEHPDRARRQRRQPHPPGGPLGGQITQNHTQRMTLPHLIVPVRHQHQHRHPAQPPPQEAHQVNGRLISPMQILHRHHGEDGRGKLGRERGEQPVPRRPPAAQPGQIPTGLRADIKQRAQRPRGQQAITGTPQPAGSPAATLERLQQRGLANPGLPRHQNQPAITTARLSRILGQRIQERRPLQQIHRQPPTSAEGPPPPISARRLKSSMPARAPGTRPILNPQVPACPLRSGDPPAPARQTHASCNNADGA